MERTDRRTLLKATAGLAAVGLAGCTNRPQPDPPLTTKWTTSRGDGRNSGANGDTTLLHTEFEPVWTQQDEGHESQSSGEAPFVFLTDSTAIGLYPDGSAVGYDLESGTVRWQTTAETAYEGGVLAGETLVAVGDGTLTAIGANDGRTRWRQPGTESITFSTALSAGESSLYGNRLTVYAGDADAGRVAVVDGASGDLRTVAQIEGIDRVSQPMVAAATETTLVVPGESAIAGVDPTADFQRVFHVETPVEGVPVYHYGLAVVPRDDQTIRAIDCTRDVTYRKTYVERETDGTRLLWETTLPSRLTGPGARSGTLIVYPTASGLVAVEAVTGRVQWSIETGQPRTPPVASRGLVYAVTDGGQLVVIDAQRGRQLPATETQLDAERLAINRSRLVGGVAADGPASTPAVTALTGSQAATGFEPIVSNLETANGMLTDRLVSAGDNEPLFEDRLVDVRPQPDFRDLELSEIGMDVTQRTEELTGLYDEGRLSFLLTRGLLERTAHFVGQLDHALAGTHRRTRLPETVAGSPRVGADRIDLPDLVTESGVMHSDEFDRYTDAGLSETQGYAAIRGLIRLAFALPWSKALKGARLLRYGDEAADAAQAARRIDYGQDIINVLRTNAVGRFARFVRALLDQLTTVGLEATLQLLEEKARLIDDMDRVPDWLTEAAEKLIEDAIEEGRYATERIEPDAERAVGAVILAAEGFQQFLTDITSVIVQTYADLMERRMELPSEQIDRLRSDEEADDDTEGPQHWYDGMTVGETLRAISENQAEITRLDELPGNHPQATAQTAITTDLTIWSMEVGHSVIDSLQFSLGPTIREFTAWAQETKYRLINEEAPVAARRLVSPDSADQLEERIRERNDAQEELVGYDQAELKGMAVGLAAQFGYEFFLEDPILAGTMLTAWFVGKSTSASVLGITADTAPEGQLLGEADSAAMIDPRAATLDPVLTDADGGIEDAERLFQVTQEFIDDRINE